MTLDTRETFTNWLLTIIVYCATRKVEMRAFCAISKLSINRRIQFNELFHSFFHFSNFIVKMRKNDFFDFIYRIKKLKKIENYSTWKKNFKFIMMMTRLWSYILRRVKVSMSSIKSLTFFVIAFDETIIVDVIIAKQKKNYKKEKKKYENELMIWKKKHEKCMIMFTLACDEKSRIFIKNFTNANKTYEILKREYDIIDLIIIDASIQKLCRVNCVDKEELTQYSTHMKYHINILLQSDIILLSSFLDFIFKMNFSLDQTQYIFFMIHFVKTRDVELIIDEIIVALVDL